MQFYDCCSFTQILIFPERTGKGSDHTVSIEFANGEMGTQRYWNASFRGLCTAL